MTTPTVLLTGFEPFGGEAVNPSALIAQALHGQLLQAGGTQARVEAVVLPCVFGAALQVLDAALRQHRPLLVLAKAVVATYRCEDKSRAPMMLAAARKMIATWEEFDRKRDGGMDTASLLEAYPQDG
jgi:hypothetical protein